MRTASKNGYGLYLTIAISCKIKIIIGDGHIYSNHIDQIKKHVLELGAEGENAAEDAISQLEKMGILYGEKGKFLTLALPHNANL